jgi:hypothetical protein
MQQFDTRAVTVLATAKLQRLVMEPDFNIVSVERVGLMRKID